MYALTRQASRFMVRHIDICQNWASRVILNKVIKKSGTFYSASVIGQKWNPFYLLIIRLQKTLFVNFYRLRRSSLIFLDILSLSKKILFGRAFKDYLIQLDFVCSKLKIPI